uniref:Uncharacterized protein n=1 Tax=Solibacter usitatus (strain Ellin6076) TaxID=234267 RepID=Q01PP3_SOLUE
MNFLILPISLMCGLVLGATAISVFLGYRAHRLVAEMSERMQRPKPREDDQLRPLRESVEALAIQVRDLQHHPHVPAPPGMPKAGFNLSKRSQALRMHRRGEAPEKIAVALELPRQEVDLLLKVHRIVIQNV